MLNDFAQSLLVILLSLGFTLLPLGYLGLHYLRFQLRQNTESFHCEHPWTNPQPEAAVDASAPALERPTVVGFFHPYCNAGGGGERVLWTAIHALQKRHPAVRAVVYTGDTDVDEATILNHAVAHFNIPLDISRIHLVFLTQRRLVGDDRYPYLTLLGQSLGSVALGYEALRTVVPDVFVDTMGYAFTYPLVWHLTGVPVVAYVHYPTISSDMVSKLPTASQLSHFPLPRRLLKLTYTTGKRIYYSLFAKLYGWAGGHASRITVNSTWTKNHIDQLWRSAPTSPDEDSEASIASIEGARVVYPPCDTDAFQSFPIDSRPNTIVSVAQFRPEKNHAQQLRAFALYLRRPTAQPGVRLVVLGSCRNQQDQDRVVKLQTLAGELGVADRVEFVVNASFPELQLRLATALIGLHTMVEEHFGIGIVELMVSRILGWRKD
ncbi:asparagine-linked glycosylation protein [Tieghemiomyces parasiticus]|uniref:GDP-Man:Man(3)GlcNAc(2)-PP-Dol alpha-1,2-mannosyltransferase n=1 Tax=Tieghemiomyces parasiticus TaxID=78921 RepID=A0A9W8AIF0_9FUNG|nr:asparagine-linked glycosylation protein [Tieghemiomyces parasiticus]